MKNRKAKRFIARFLAVTATVFAGSTGMPYTFGVFVAKKYYRMLLSV
jgi:hypothetical protein